MRYQFASAFRIYEKNSNIFSGLLVWYILGFFVLVNFRKGEDFHTLYIVVSHTAIFFMLF